MGALTAGVTSATSTFDTRPKREHGGGPLTGPSPTDRGKSGSKIHLITGRNGLPLSLGISGANMHDSLRLKPLARGIPPVRSRRDPRRRRPVMLHADKGYGYGHLRRWLSNRGIRHRIARKGHRALHTSGPPPLGRREDGLLAGRMPAPASPLRTPGRAHPRTQGRALPRLRRYSRSSHHYRRRTSS
ncbi:MULTISPECIES: transposase [unclassified Streptomyces]|uniref:transposase n=1 Tax=Streptomyces sp. SceaMP-e96 TaxID=1100824 RepID=UPI000B83B1EC|nr:transposase [Streptomyces sp. SID4951]